MDSSVYSRSPSFSSRGTSSLYRQFRVYYQPIFTVQPYVIQAPSISSTRMSTFKLEFPTSGDQHSVAGEFCVQAPSYSAFQQGVRNSINRFSGENGDCGVTQTYYGAQAPNLSDVVHENYSATGFNRFAALKDEVLQRTKLKKCFCIVCISESSTTERKRRGFTNLK
ncbi:hypothetical protein E3N88_42228 [Mikania micrantha]|uniref:Uncharacterized protein n=1 Tax=Mikania micrantha TaxID=192012 RepID=A0A5N6LIL2_9ASTR|nr:hypothetical protein E3N88_42228 [Mikania micrantha]